MSARGAGPMEFVEKFAVFRLRAGFVKYDVRGLALRTGDRVVEFILVLPYQIRCVFVEQPDGAAAVCGENFEVNSAGKTSLEILQVGDGFIRRPQEKFFRPRRFLAASL